MDAFTAKRLTKFIASFRQNKAQLPTLKDFMENGFTEAQVSEAEKKKLIEKFYVTLTNGTIVKGYKIREE